MGIISWARNLFTEAPSPSTYTEPAPLQSRVPTPFDWQSKVVILSPAPNCYKDWVYVDDLYREFKHRLKEEV